MKTLVLNPEVMKYAPWAASKIDVAEQCTQRFHYKFVENIKEPGVIDSRGRIGSAAHKALELILNGSDEKLAFKKAAIDNKLTTPEVDDFIAYRGKVAEFIKRIESYEKRNPTEERLVEYKFGFTPDFQPTSFWDKKGLLRGVFDLGLHLKADALIILDHKSGEEKDIREYAKQLDIYAVAATIIRPTIKGTQAAIHYVKTGKISWSDYIDKAYIEENLRPWLINRLNEATAKVAAGPVPVEGWWCSFCGFKNRCPAWNK